jgi:hypothetical protein
MEKLFTPNKWFVLFCALFIGIFFTLQWVISTRIQTKAKEVGEDIFTWIWVDKNLCASADMTDAKILKRDANDAVVEVSGTQTVCPYGEKSPAGANVQTSKCKAILTFYRQQNDWALGKVELE